MTLRNLQQMVDKADPLAAHEKVTAKTVRESGADIIASVTTSDGSMLRVYDNGYVVYSNGLRVTVFPLHDINGDYYYQTQMDPGRPDMIINEDEILSMPWYLGVLMKAEDRIVHSQNNSKTNGYLILDGLMSELTANKEDESCDALVDSGMNLTEAIRHVMWHSGETIRNEAVVYGDIMKGIESRNEGAQDSRSEKIAEALPPVSKRDSVLRSLREKQQKVNAEFGFDSHGHKIDQIRKSLKAMEEKQIAEAISDPAKKPKLEVWQQYFENGEYLRAAEITEEQNYNMIDGTLNNRAPRRSVIKRLQEKQTEVGHMVPLMQSPELMSGSEIERKK